ncbi:hypothetical protein [Mesorhizobium sp.]|uniref:hypothetical protein n=1 Tax=Mesorhizobium sp. TaxID=1871066 RepID=UPI000FE8FD39|nr:hypothetical protein [Mesorhizobium sp.]RWP27752.1 MAG: hypothetical protein EOR02_22440 [Mesorhizobium sp.]
MSDKYWQKQKGLSLFIPSLEKSPTGRQNPSELVLTVLRRWTSIFSRLEKIEPLCRPSGQLVAPYAAQGGIS